MHYCEAAVQLCTTLQMGLRSPSVICARDDVFEIRDIYAEF